MTRTLDQALSAADLSAMSAYNLLVNGFQTVSQQYGTTAFGGTGSGGYYVTDQWAVSQTGTFGVSGQQVLAPFNSQPDIQNGLKISITTAQAALTASDNLVVYQPLEGTNLARLLYGAANAKTVPLAFMIRSSIALTGYVSLASFNSSTTVIRSHAVRYTAAANTDTFVYLTIPGDTAQTLLSTNARSLDVRWCFGTGTTYQGTAGAWSSSNVLAASDVTNLAATVGNNVILSGAVMFPGVVPISQSTLPLLARRYDDELRLCQRYYETGSYSALGYGVGGGALGTMPPHVAKRVSPTTTATATVSNNCGAPTSRPLTAGQIQVYAVASTTGNMESTGSFTSNARM